MDAQPDTRNAGDQNKHGWALRSHVGSIADGAAVRSRRINDRDGRLRTSLRCVPFTMCVILKVSVRVYVSRLSVRAAIDSHLRLQNNNAHAPRRASGGAGRGR